jgi:hypothetical protein
MRYFHPAFAVLVFALTTPAFAQSMPGTNQTGAGGDGPTIQPRAPTPDVAPPALPGAGAVPGLATAPQVARTISGDPTTALFDAINKNDYNAAQDALSRGADLTAQDPLGETPLELSIDLNHNSITFMILAARNETGVDAGPLATGEGSINAMPIPAPKATRHVHAVPAAMETPPAAGIKPQYGSKAATPNPSAGFLGFNGQ